MKYKIKRILYSLVMLAAASCSSINSTTAQIEYPNMTPFGVSYEKIDPAIVKGYRLLIVEPNNYNKAEVSVLKSSGAKVIAYISLGEVNKNRWYYSILEERGFLGKNKNWDSYYINLADPVTYALFFDEIIPEIEIRGFDGLFLDTVDAVAPYTSRTNLQPYMVDLINGIHQKYPDFLIIQNAGFFLLDKTASSVDAVLVEDVATHYDFKTDSYTLKSADLYQKKVAEIKALSDSNKIPFIILDFAKDEALRKRAVQRLDSLSYPYFINNIELNDLARGITGNHQ